ncbi:MAG: flagellar basal body rod protein FlgC [Phycisphaerales bacterium]|nr:flagellar basal body rod protein FlgC [Phycisphaerales bacterium]
MYGSLDVSTSGMVAQRIRLNVIASNIANTRSMYDAQGNYDPYRRRAALLAAGDPSGRGPQGRSMGVHVTEIDVDQNALRKVYDPGNPVADPDGYISVPDIDPVLERVNAMEASRAYEANVVAAEATKSMVAQALRLLA